MLSACGLGCAERALANCNHRHLPVPTSVLYNAEDVRSYKFAAFDAKEELQPTQPQLDAAEHLIDALDLAQGISCSARYCLHAHSVKS